MGLPIMSSAPLEAWVRGNPQRAREQIIERGTPDFAESLLEAIKPGQRYCAECERPGFNASAMRLFAKIAGWVGADTQVVIAIWQQLGVKDDHEARSLIEQARSVEHLDANAAAELALAKLTEHYRAEGFELITRRIAEAEDVTEGANGHAASG